MKKRLKHWLCAALCMGILLPLLAAVPAKGATSVLFDVSNGNINISLEEVKVPNPAYVPPDPENPPVTPIPETISQLRLVIAQTGLPKTELEDFSTPLTLAGQTRAGSVTIDTDISAFKALLDEEGNAKYPDLQPFTLHLSLSALYLNSVNAAAIRVKSGSGVDLSFTGVTSLFGGSGYAALNVERGATVTLIGAVDAAGVLGSLRAYGGANAAGIGGNASGQSGSIVIESGFITARGSGAAYDLGGASPLAGEVVIAGGSVWPMNEKVSSPYSKSTPEKPPQPLYPVRVPARRGTESLMGLPVSGPYLNGGGLTRTISAMGEHGPDFPKHMSALVWLPVGVHTGFGVGNYTGGIAQVVQGIPDWDQNRLYWGYEPEASFNMDLGDITVSLLRSIVQDQDGSPVLDEQGQPLTVPVPGRLEVLYGSGKTAQINATDLIQIYGKREAQNNSITVNGAGLFSTVKLELVEISLNATSRPALELVNGPDVALELLGESYLNSKGAWGAVRVPAGARLTVDGPISARLWATSGGSGAGIGGANNESNGAIILNGGTIVATGAGGAAGIGAGAEAAGGKVILNGGIIIAKGPVGNANGGFDIGSGRGNKSGQGTEINGGNIYCSNTAITNQIEGAANGRSPVYPVTLSYEYRGLQTIQSPVGYEAVTITDDLAYGTIFPFQLSACIWIPIGSYDGTITVGAAPGGCAEVVESPLRDQNRIYWKSAVIMTDSLLAGTVGQDYFAELVSVTASTGRWSIVAGALPPGLILNGKTIVGTPTKEGRYSFTLMVTLSNGTAETRALSIVITRAPYTPPAEGPFYDRDKDPVPTATTGTRKVQTESGSVTVPYSRSGRVFTFVIDHRDSTRLIDLATRQVTFDVSDTKAVDSVTLDKAALIRFRDAGVTVRVNLPQGSFILNPPALSSLVGKASTQITFTIKKAEVTSLNRDQRNAAGNNAVYQISAYTGPEQITVFDSPLTVTLPFSMPYGSQSFQVWHLDRLGMTEAVPFNYTYGTGVLSFETRSLAHFIVGYSAAWKSPFTDVSANDWFYDHVRYMVLNGIDSGVSDRQYSPYTPLTRATLVTMLGRLAGADVGRYSGSAFSDVSRSAAYRPYVEWARANGIVSGIDSRTFAPERTITREELAVILTRFNSYQNKTLPVQRDAMTFSDRSSISSWARNSVNLLYQANILEPSGGTAFNPKGIVTRADISAILHRYSLRAL